MSETVRRPNLAPFLDDPDCWLVASIENYDEDSDTATTGPIFTQRVIHPPVEPVISSAADALAVTLHEAGRVDVDRIAELLGRPRGEVLAELGDAVFLNPALTLEGFEVWETADAYLSGSVRTKLAVAEATAGADPRYARNVAALRAIQPEDLKPSDITARLGAPWSRRGGVVRRRADRRRGADQAHRRDRVLVFQHTCVRGDWRPRRRNGARNAATLANCSTTR